MSSFESAHAGHLAKEVGEFASVTSRRGHRADAPLSRGVGGRDLVDNLAYRIGDRLHKISPLFGGPFNDSSYLRSIFGNAYLALPLVAVALAIWGLTNTGGMAIPPALGISLSLMVIGVLDAFSGLLAFVVYALGVIVTGHFISLHLVAGPTGTQGLTYSFTGLFGLALLWFIAPQLAGKMRPFVYLRDEVGLERLYLIAADFLVLPFLTVLILGSMPALMPSLTGASRQGLADVNIQEHLTVIKIVVAGAMVVRVAIELGLHRRFAPLPLSAPATRPTWIERTLKAGAALLALLLIWEVMGSMWQTYAVWVLFLLTEKITEIGERFLKPSVALRYLPRNLFKILLTLIFSQYAMKVLNGTFVSGTAVLGWLAISLSGLTILFAILEGAHHKIAGHGTAPVLDNASTPGRVMGFVVVLGLFLVSQGFVGIEAKSYSAPHGIQVALDGTIYIADSGNNRVIRIGVDGTRTTVGTGLVHPFDVSVDASSSTGLIYISDTGNNRILAVTPAPHSALAPPRFDLRSFAAPVATQRSVGSDLKAPTGISVDLHGRVYVCDSGHNRVVLLDPSGSQQTVVSDVLDPQSVFVDPFGNLWVTDTGRGKILKFALNADGTVQTESTFASGLAQPSGVAVDAANNVFISNTGKNQVLEYLPNGTRIVVAGEFSHPGVIGMNSAGHAYVTNVTSGEVKIVTPYYVAEPDGVAPSKAGTAVALNPDGSSYVVSSAAGTLEHLTKSGRHTLISGLDQPGGVAVSALGRLYVSEAGTGTISEIAPNGQKTIIATGLTGVTSLTADPYGGLFAIQPTLGNVLTVSPSGVVHMLSGGLTNPVDVIQDAFGYIDVALAGTGHHDGSVERLVLGGTPQLLAQGLDSVLGVSADANGNVFFIEGGHQHRIWEYLGPLGSQIVAEGSATTGEPTAIAADRRGNVYILEANPNQVYRFKLTAQAQSM